MDKNANRENLTASLDVVERLRHLMHDKRITQRALADYAETSPSQFSRIMNGELAISLQHIANIATALHMEIIDVFTYPDIYRDKLNKETYDLYFRGAKLDEQTVIKNIVKIRESKGLTKRKVADALNINEASYGRIESGRIALSYNYLALIAGCFDMSVVDVITYPDVYMPKETDSDSVPVEAVLQIKLRSDKRDQVLNLIFGDNNLEILNK